MAKIDRGGRWHATIPRKGNRWIDMPGEAMKKFGDLLERDFSDGGGAEEQETVAWVRDYERIVVEELEDDNVEAAQTHVQEVLDAGLLEELDGEMEGGISEEDTTDPLSPSGIHEALQAFVDIDPDDFRELAQAGEAEDDSASEPESEPASEPAEVNFKDLMKLDYRELPQAVSAYYYFQYGKDDFPEHLQQRGRVPGKKAMQPDDPEFGKAALGWYVDEGNGGDYINQALRDTLKDYSINGWKPEERMPEDQQARTVEIAEAAEKYVADSAVELPEDSMLYRGIELKALEQLDLTPGAQIPMSGLFSTSADRKIGEDFANRRKWVTSGKPGALIEIVAPKGSKVTSAHVKEQELILQPGDLEIVSVDTSGKVPVIRASYKPAAGAKDDEKGLALQSDDPQDNIKMEKTEAASSVDESEEKLAMKTKTSKIGAFVKIDAGGQWHATIPKKGNRWIDMPGAAMAELYDMVAKAGSQGNDYDSGPGSKADEDEAVIEDSLAQIQEKNKAVHELLEKGDEQSVSEAQGIAQEVVDNFPWEDYAGEDTSYVEDEAGEEIQQDSAETIREALQAFVDIDPADFLEKAQAGGEAEAGDAEPAEGAPESGEGPDLSDVTAEEKKKLKDLENTGYYWQSAEPEDKGWIFSNPSLDDVAATKYEGDGNKLIFQGKHAEGGGGSAEGAPESDGSGLRPEESAALQSIIGPSTADGAIDLPQIKDSDTTNKLRRRVIDGLLTGKVEEAQAALKEWVEAIEVDKLSDGWKGALSARRAKSMEFIETDPEAIEAFLEENYLRPFAEGKGEVRGVIAPKAPGWEVEGSSLVHESGMRLDLTPGWADYGGWSIGGPEGWQDVFFKGHAGLYPVSGFDLKKPKTLDRIASYAPGEGEEVGKAEPLQSEDEELALKSESREDRASLVASGKTKRKLAAPVKPPAAWFENPNFKMSTPLTVTKEGRVFGHLALWGTCHAAYANASGDCIVVPGSNADYAMFHLGVVETAEGTEVPVGRLAMETTHADDQFSSRRAIAHYENTGLAIADIHAGEDEFGIWFSGALRPDATESQIRSLKASPLSGDWRYYPQTNDLELVMALAVNMPGFAVPRPKFMVASGQVRSLVAAGILAPKRVPREKVEAAKSGDQLAIDDIKYLQKLAARERANEAKILKRRALVASGVPDKIHALAEKLIKPTSVEEK